MINSSVLTSVNCGVMVLDALMLPNKTQRQGLTEGLVRGFFNLDPGGGGSGGRGPKGGAGGDAVVVPVTATVWAMSHGGEGSCEGLEGFGAEGSGGGYRGGGSKRTGGVGGGFVDCGELSPDGFDLVMPFVSEDRSTIDAVMRQGQDPRLTTTPGDRQGEGGPNLEPWTLDGFDALSCVHTHTPIALPAHAPHMLTHHNQSFSWLP